eukprot:Clim_evm33s207 gene=Clim_evmTU33s207
MSLSSGDSGLTNGMLRSSESPVNNRGWAGPLPPNIHLVKYSKYLHYLHSMIRNDETSPREFAHYANLLHTMILQQAFDLLVDYSTRKELITPTQKPFEGYCEIPTVTAVSIMRAADSFERAVREVFPTATIGKVLIQRNERTAEPVFIYEKYPKTIVNSKTLLLDPMVATGGSAITAINHLLAKGVAACNIVFVNVIAAPEGLKAVMKAHPEVNIITSWIDDCLNEKCYILPGVGDYGDRYYGTIN